MLASSSCEYWSARQANSLHPPRTEEQPQACSTGRSDPWLLKCKAKRKAAASVGKQANTQTVCIRLHQRAAASLPCPTSWSDHWRLSCKPKRKAAAWVGKHLLRVSTKQANNLHPPRTEEQPQACSTGRRHSWWLWCKAKRKAAASVGKQLVPATAQANSKFASTAHRRAATSLLDWSETSLAAQVQCIISRSWLKSPASAVLAAISNVYTNFIHDPDLARIILCTHNYCWILFADL